MYLLEVYRIFLLFQLLHFHKVLNLYFLEAHSVICKLLFCLIYVNMSEGFKLIILMNMHFLML